MIFIKFLINNEYGSFFEEIISIRKIWFFSFFFVGFCPSLSNSSLHIFISFFVHFFHHIHYSCSGILGLILFFLSCEFILFIRQLSPGFILLLRESDKKIIVFENIFRLLWNDLTTKFFHSKN